jgi:PHP domain
MGACDVDQLMKIAVEQKMPAVAMTDHGNPFGVTNFCNPAKATGVHPLIGAKNSSRNGGTSIGATKTHAPEILLRIQTCKFHSDPTGCSEHANLYLRDRANIAPTKEGPAWAPARKLSPQDRREIVAGI